MPHPTPSPSQCVMCTKGWWSYLWGNFDLIFEAIPRDCWSYSWGNHDLIFEALTIYIYIHIYIYTYLWNSTWNVCAVLVADGLQMVLAGVRSNNVGRVDSPSRTLRVTCPTVCSGSTYMWPGFVGEGYGQFDAVFCILAIGVPIFFGPQLGKLGAPGWCPATGCELSRCSNCKKDVIWNDMKAHGSQKQVHAKFKMVLYVTALVPECQPMPMLIHSQLWIHTPDLRYLGIDCHSVKHKK